MRRDSGYTFSQVPRAEIPRSVQNRNHTHKTTIDAGYLIPFYVDEILPGDTFNLSANLFARMATPIVPVMDNLFLDVFFFFVPNRLVWDSWQRFCGERPQPNDSTDFVVPKLSSGVGGFARGSMFDYLGIPPEVPNLSVNALPLRGYNLIFNEWFRDQNMVGRMTQIVGDSGDTVAHYPLMRRGKRHDYFTSCLPWPQKGPGVALPIGTTAPVMGVAFSRGALETAGAPPNAYETSGQAASDWTGYLYTNTPASSIAFETQGAPNTDLRPALYADLSQATSATINSLREAFQLQKMLERDARGGTRYVELLRSHFGVTSPDARLQRPEFLGGASLPVSINPVMQTSGTPKDPATGEFTTPQGNLAAYGLVGGRAGFTKSFVEHGYVLGLVSVRADYTYQQGLNRMWTREVREEFYWPSLAHLGEQAVLTQEIYATGGAGDGVVFGYQERWAEYRYHPSLITGKFRSTDPQSLDVWHLAQEFTSAPVLNETFISENPPIARVVAVPSEPHFLLDTYIQCRAARPMPLYSVPGYIDHF